MGLKMSEVIVDYLENTHEGNDVEVVITNEDNDVEVVKREAFEKEVIECKTPAPDYISGSDLTPLPWYSKYKDPQKFNNADDIRLLFAEINLHENVSDIVIKSGSPVAIKIKRFGLKAITHRCLNHSEVLIFAQTLTNDSAVASRISRGTPISGMAQVMDKANFNINTGIQTSKNRYRFEVTACSSKDEANGLSIILRPLPDAPYKYSDIGIPLDFVEKCIVKDGIVIVAGATGEGKSTTIASVIRYIMENDTPIKGNLLTHEDPIEVSYHLIHSKHSEVMQSSIGQGDHVISFNDANRSAMRRSPDLVLVGELRDEDTITSAIELSLTGHPVLATTHASYIGAIFPRLISRFPKEVQGQKGFDLVDTVRFLVAQKLIWTTKGKRIAIREELVIDEGLRTELLKYAERTDVLYKLINSIMKNGSFGAISYQAQADKMLAEGIIDEKNYFYLVGKNNQLSEKQVDMIRSYVDG